jgi:putative peptide maturation system protein
MSTEQINWQEFVALEVNGEAITLPEILGAAQFRGQLGFLQASTDAALIRQAAAQQGIEVSDEELQAAADQFRTRHELHKAAQLLQWLAERHLSLGVWESLLEEEILTEKLRTKLTDGKVELHFAQNKLSFEAATISRIAVATESLAKELRSQIREEDADFYALARQHSIDATTRPASGYAGVVRRADLISTLEAAIFGATVGAVVGPCKTEAGWELVKVEAQHPAQLDEATRDQIVNTLFDEWLSERRGKARITVPLFDLLREEDEE